jgi:hypothetical protein
MVEEEEIDEGWGGEREGEGEGEGECLEGSLREGEELESRRRRELKGAW